LKDFAKTILSIWMVVYRELKARFSLGGGMVFLFLTIKR
jgi:hypothetical protein